MLRLRVLAHWFMVGSLAAAWAIACGSSAQHVKKPQASAGAAGDDAGGAPSSGGGTSEPPSDAGAGGQLSGAAGDDAGAGAGGLAAGNAGAAAGGAPNVEAGGAGGSQGGAPVDFGVPTDVDAFGCFVRSGDGGDLLPDGSIAVNVTSSVYSAACDSAWVSANADAFAPQETPTTLIMRRAFVIDPQFSGGVYTITYKADDAVDFILNGQLIVGCTPPADNQGLCQQVCSTSVIPAGVLKPAGQVNLLEARLINTQSVSTGNGNFGYTALNYSVCVGPSE